MIILDEQVEGKPKGFYDGMMRVFEDVIGAEGEDRYNRYIKFVL